MFNFYGDDDPDYEDWAKATFGKFNLGFAYENALFSRYKGVGLVPFGFSPAGADATAADLELWTAHYPRGILGDRIKIEVKLDTKADYGQASLSHTGNSWKLTGKNTSEAREMRRLLEQMGIVAQINQAWPREQPNLFKYKNSKEVPDKEKQTDLEKYPSKYLTGSGFANAFATYYNTKGVNYIQIGGKGLYYLKSDPNGLRDLGATGFLDSGATMKLRIRTKTSKSDGTYRFSTALLIDNPPRKSGFDLDTEGALERLRWDAVDTENAPYQLKSQRGMLL